MKLIPMPKQVNYKEGSFILNDETIILLDKQCDYQDFEAALALKEEIFANTGLKLSIVRTADVDVLNYIMMERRNKQSQSYKIEISEYGVRLIGDSSSGLFYATQTLRQIIRNKGAILPRILISDSPDYLVRGFYHDITRGKVPTLETLKDIVDKMAFYKLNQLQLYVEHTFAFRKYSEIWTGEDPITAEEIIILDEYCKSKHIELVPSLSTFGHLYHALTSESLKHLNELDVDKDEPFTWVNRQVHHTLDVSNSDSLKFVKDILDEFIPLFTSDKFNICCDETFDLGEGKNKELSEKVGKDRLYIDFLKEIMAYVKSHNKKIMFWGDIILKCPQYLSELPAEDVICLNWDYTPDVDGEAVRKIQASGIEQYVCPGVHGWNRVMNNIDIASRNIFRMAEFGMKYGAKGVLNTDWGDFGHVNLLSNSIPGMAFGAGVSWNLDSGKVFSTIYEAISYVEFGDKSGKLVETLKTLSDQTIMDWDRLVLWYYNKKKYCIDSYNYEQAYLPLMMDSTEEEILRNYNRIIELGQEINKVYTDINENHKQDLQEYIVSVRILGYLQAMLLIIKKYSFGQHINNLIFTPDQMAVKLEYWLAEYSGLWRQMNKESGLFRIKDFIIDLCKILRNFKHEGRE